VFLSTVCTDEHSIYTGSLFFFLKEPPTPGTYPFPYTTLFRSLGRTGPAAEAGTPPDRVTRQQVPPRMKKASGETEAFPHSGRSLDRKSTRLNSSHVKISYAVFCLKKKKKQPITIHDS